MPKTISLSELIKRIDLEELADFLVRAKKQTYAGGGREIPSQRTGFKELEHSEGEFNYKDSYSGFYTFSGQEVVWYKGIPIWSMLYDGGMRKEYVGDHAFTKKTYGFLKEALLRVEESKPFRGPERFEKGDYEYLSGVTGDIKNFWGYEEILYKGRTVFSLDYIGGLILDENLTNLVLQDFLPRSQSLRFQKT